MDTFRIKIKEFYHLDQEPFLETKGSYFPNGQFKQDQTNNKLRSELAKFGDYIPKYNLSKTNFGTPEQSLVLEFSAPKLLHGTNLHEVSEKDFSAIIEKLISFLKILKVSVQRSSIENSIVTSAAFARNICVTKFGTTQEILRIIASFDYRPRSDYSDIIYSQKHRHAEIKYFNRNSHLVLYDKLSEIITNGKTKEEKEIIKRLQSRANPLLPDLDETLRVELTLHTKTAIRQALSPFYGRSNNFSFVQVFKDDVCSQILSKEISSIFNHPLKKVVLLSGYREEVLNKLINKHCKTSIQRSDLRFAIDTIGKQGLSAYRKIILQDSCERTWFRKLKKLRVLLEPMKLLHEEGHVDNLQVLDYILSQFGISSKLSEPEQPSLFDHE